MGRPSLIILIAMAVIGSWMFFNDVPLDRMPWGEGSLDPASMTTPIASGDTRYLRIRIATFNLDSFDSAKAAQPDVMRALAHIIGQFDVVALQEIKSAEHHLLPGLVDEINQRQSGLYDFVVGPRVGRESNKEQFAWGYSRTDRDECD